MPDLEAQPPRLTHPQATLVRKLLEQFPGFALKTLLPALLLNLGPAPGPAKAQPNGNQFDRCLAAQPGRYVVMAEGSRNGIPIAQLIQEDWGANGSINGTAYIRIGKVFQQLPYKGSWHALRHCLVDVKRQNNEASSHSRAALNQQGLPLFGLSQVPGTVLSERYWRQTPATCTAASLDGLVLSQQKGLSWAQGQWLPNAVLQREQWVQGKVQGLALSSYNGTIEQAPYSGRIEVKPNCLARLEETDNKGVAYRYQAIVLTGSRGYLYLQTDSDDLTLGLLEHQP
jgi:hypothetical protein